MILAVSITTLSLPLLVASVASVGSVAAKNIVRSHRNARRIEQEFKVYDRAFEIYSHLAPTAGARSQLVVSEELILLTALHSCGGIDDEAYRRAKAHVTSAETVESVDVGPSSEGPPSPSIGLPLPGRSVMGSGVGRPYRI